MFINIKDEKGKDGEKKFNNECSKLFLILRVLIKEECIDAVKWSYIKKTSLVIDF